MKEIILILIGSIIAFITNLLYNIINRKIYREKVRKQIYVYIENDITLIKKIEHSFVNSQKENMIKYLKSLYNNDLHDYYIKNSFIISIDEQKRIYEYIRYKQQVDIIDDITIEHYLMYIYAYKIIVSLLTKLNDKMELNKVKEDISEIIKSQFNPALKSIDNEIKKKEIENLISNLNELVK